MPKREENPAYRRAIEEFYRRIRESGDLDGIHRFKVRTTGGKSIEVEYNRRTHEVSFGGTKKVAILTLDRAEGSPDEVSKKCEKLLGEGFAQVWAFAPGTFLGLSRELGRMELPLVISEEKLESGKEDGLIEKMAGEQYDRVVSGPVLNRVILYPKAQVIADVPQEAKPHHSAVPWTIKDQDWGSSGWEQEIKRFLDSKGIRYTPHVTFQLDAEGIPTYTPDFVLKVRPIVVEPHHPVDNDFVKKLTLFGKKYPNYVRILVTNDELTAYSEKFCDYIAPFDPPRHEALEDILKFKLKVI